MKNSLFTKLEKASVVAFVLLLLTGAGINNAFAQNVGINTVTPNASAMLDVVSTNSGILVPRITMAQRDAIVTPATSLLIYQTDNTAGYYYNSGTPAAPVWVRLFSGTITGGEWTDAGTYLYPNENTSAQVYEDNNLYGFYYSGLAETPGYFVSTEANVDNAGVIGACNNTDYYGLGGLFYGGFQGVHGEVAPTGPSNYYGVEGYVEGGTGTNYGVYGSAYDGAKNYGVYGRTNGNTDAFGVVADNLNATGTALLAQGNNIGGTYLTGGSGIAATGTNIGIFGTATSTSASAIYGNLTAATGFALDGRNDDPLGTGIIGVGNGGSVYVVASGAGGVFNGDDGVHAYGNVADATGLVAIGNDCPTVYTLTAGTGVAGSSTIAGVYGCGNATAGSKGIYGDSKAADGTGVFGINLINSDDATGLWGQTGDGTSSTFDMVGVYGRANNLNTTYGIGGIFIGNWNGVYGESTSGAGYGGYFYGDTYSTGDVGGATKSFVIDNPANPDNEVLRHTCIESDEALVMYRGKVKLDASGKAIVDMPSYFTALTKETEATVQITCIGQPFGIGYEWNSGNASFIVYGDANREISWMVMADRDDPYMQQNRKPVITQKNGGEKGYKAGYYIHPELYGQSEEKSYTKLWNTNDRTKRPVVMEVTNSNKVKQTQNDNKTVIKANVLNDSENSDKKNKASK